MNKSDKKKTLFLVSISAVAIILLFFVNIKSVQTTQDQYASYFVSTTQNSVNLTRAYQDQIALWQLGEISNATMAEITDRYLSNFTDQMNSFNRTTAPDIFVDAKNNLVDSFLNEIKSYNFFQDYLLTGNKSKNEISTDYLSESLRYEAQSYKLFENVVNNTS